MSLDNFHTSNPVPPNNVDWFPTGRHRNRAIQDGLANSNTTGDWANRVPIGPVQPADTAMRMSSRPDPQMTEHRDGISDHLYVRTRPVTQRLVGDTADSILLYQAHVCPMRKWWSNFKLPLKLKGNKAIHHRPY